MVLYEVRKKLEEINGEIGNFTATIGRTSFKIIDDKLIPTIILKNIKNEDNLIVANHLWQESPILIKNYKQNDKVSFTGKVINYTKSVGSIDYTIDIDLSTINRIN